MIENAQNARKRGRIRTFNRNRERLYERQGPLSITTPGKTAIFGERIPLAKTPRTPRNPEFQTTERQLSLLCFLCALCALYERPFFLSLRR
jgi:hypothetical protein